jgi:hypothetical protein
VQGYARVTLEILFLGLIPSEIIGPQAKKEEIEQRASAS